MKTLVLLRIFTNPLTNLINPHPPIDYRRLTLINARILRIIIEEFYCLAGVFFFYETGKYCILVRSFFIST
ncbi:MAG: hypothetical protein BA864_03300 [Desulfuromonadales bacterium C00003093]|nr:MAG: hypothetical protein BA864_03300 [Desulfuromonadales bacterium C00003093]